MKRTIYNIIKVATWIAVPFLICQCAPLYPHPLPVNCLERFKVLAEFTQKHEPDVILRAKIGRGPRGHKHIELMEWRKGFGFIPTDGRDTVVKVKDMITVRRALRECK